MENNNIIDEDNRKLNYRGVEKYTTAASCLVQDRRHIAYDIVHSLQDEHPDFMAKCLLSNSMDSQKEAYDRGIADQLAAMKANEKKNDKQSSTKSLLLSSSSSSSSSSSPSTCCQRQMVLQACMRQKLQPANRAA